MKIWHDDIRRPPDDSWMWARTNGQAQQLFGAAESLGEPVAECSLDHDLGLDDCDPDVPDADLQRGYDPENDGFQLVKWMVERDCVPDKVTIHSWNPDGAMRMASYIVNAAMNKAISNKPSVEVKRYLRAEERTY